VKVCHTSYLLFRPYLKGIGPNPPRTLNDLIAVANKGSPVIVGIPGHIMVVRGGDSTYVYLADSSLANRTQMTHQDFLSIWNKFSVLLIPQ
jgi:predicted double-glycine peptidase